jgi:hypothetical protein
MPGDVPTRASEELLAAPLDQMILNLGLAVARANAAMAKAAAAGAEAMAYDIPEADIELAVAISISKDEKITGEASLGLQAFSLSAAYTSAFGFSEQASSKIKLKLRATPVARAAANG